MRCLALFSGGLDSMLACKLIANQGIEVIALNFDIGFGGDEEKIKLMEQRAQDSGAKFIEINRRQKYLDEILFSPKYGYGKHFNPCIDCHGFMFREALNLLKEFDASFLISGEVIGQRPMSQRKDAMNQVKKLSGDAEGLILRPLSALLMKETKPELEGWVDRSKLLGLSGRGRNFQLNLAEEFGFKDYESPAGGCLLTLESFELKIKDFLKFDENLSVDDFQILRFGRHLRLPDGAKIVIGRNEIENKKLNSLKNEKLTRIYVKDLSGALVLISKNASQNDKILGSKLAATYARSLAGKEYEANIENEKFIISPLKSKDDAKIYMLN